MDQRPNPTFRIFLVGVNIGTIIGVFLYAIVSAAFKEKCPDCPACPSTDEEFFRVVFSYLNAIVDFLEPFPYQSVLFMLAIYLAVGCTWKLFFAGFNFLAGKYNAPVQDSEVLAEKSNVPIQDTEIVCHQDPPSNEDTVELSPQTYKKTLDREVEDFGKGRCDTKEEATLEKHTVPAQGFVLTKRDIMSRHIHLKPNSGKIVFLGRLTLQNQLDTPFFVFLTREHGFGYYTENSMNPFLHTIEDVCSFTVLKVDFLRLIIMLKKKGNTSKITEISPIPQTTRKDNYFVYENGKHHNKTTGETFIEPGLVQEPRYIPYPTANIVVFFDEKGYGRI